MSSTTEDLREWARGAYNTEAAAELLIRAHNGRFVTTAYPWIVERDGGGYILDGDQITNEAIEALSSGEGQLMKMVASLEIGTPVDLRNVVSLDRPTLALVLAAIAHAAGTHEHSDLVPEPNTGTADLVQLGSLYAWPAG